MDRVTVSLDEDSGEVITENVGGDKTYESKPAFVRECITMYEEFTTFQDLAELEDELVTAREQRDTAQSEAEELRELVEDLEDELEHQETRADDLRRQLKAANSKNERMQSLARYAEGERRIEQQWREAGLLTKTKWRLFGIPMKKTRLYS